MQGGEVGDVTKSLFMISDCGVSFLQFSALPVRTYLTYACVPVLENYKNL